MKFNFDERIQTNAMANFTQIYEYEKFTHQKRWASGNFELGLTIVMLSENDATKFKLFENKELKFSEATELIK